MGFNQLFNFWFVWFKSQPWSLKWFLYLILFMPFISIFYEFKTEGAFSPLQIVGVLSFILSVNFIIKKRIVLRRYEYFFLFFSVIYILNQIFFLVKFSSVGDFGFVIRNLLPIVFYFYLRRVINNKNIFEGILITFLVSSIFPYTVFLYEFFFDPIREEYISDYRGGLLRLTGFYADIFSYLSYIIGDFIIIVYFMISKKLKFKFSYLVALYFMTLLGVIGLSHQSTWIVFSFLTLIVLLHLFKSRFKLYFIPLIIIFVSLGGYFSINKYVKPLFSKELSAFQGTSDSDRMFNGRIVRWKKYYNIWDDMSFFYKSFGVGFSSSKYSKAMMSGGMHSDYVRLGFGAGILGLIFYLLFYLSLIFRKRKVDISAAFILNSSLSIMILYAVSSNPFGSSGALIYLTLATFSYFALVKF